MGKPRSDSKLKTLPPRQQGEIFALLQSTSYVQAKGIVREKFGVETSVGALCEFFAWYPTSRIVEEAASIADQLKADLKKLPGLDLDDDKLSRIGQAAFEAQALKAGDSDAFVALRKLRQKDNEHRLNERRIALLERKAAQADQAEGVTRDESLTPEQREAKMREIFGLR